MKHIFTKALQKNIKNILLKITYFLLDFLK